MTNKAAIRLEGAKELYRKLRDLPAKFARKILSKALRAGAKVVQAAAKKLAPKLSGLLRRSIKVRATKRKKGRVGFVVGTSAGDYKGKSFYGAFLEWGHRLGSRKLGSKRRKVKPKPYAGPALKQTANEAVRVIGEEINKGLEAAVK